MFAVLCATVLESGDSRNNTNIADIFVMFHKRLQLLKRLLNLETYNMLS